MKTERLVNIRPSQIEPVHELNYEDDTYQDLLSDFLDPAIGWDERPLVVVRKPYIKKSKRYRALTGCHRWHAAAAAKLQWIPCLVIEDPNVYHAIVDWDNSNRVDYHRFSRILERHGHYTARYIFDLDC